MFSVYSTNFLTSSENAAYNLKGKLGNGYYVEILVGNPAQMLNFVLDTGSSNLAVASSKNKFVNEYYNFSKSFSYEKPSDEIIVSINYTDGFWKGEAVFDNISIPSAGVVHQIKTQIVKIDFFDNFFVEDANWQGIIGLAFPEIVKPNPQVISTIMKDIHDQSFIYDMFSIELCSTGLKDMNDNISGSFVIGITQSNISVLNEVVFWTPITHAWFYEIVITEVKVGDTVIDALCTSINYDKSIVDSGTTNLRFPKYIFNKVLSEIQKSLPQELSKASYQKFWDGEDLICWKKNNSFNIFPVINITLPSRTANKSFMLTVKPEHYLIYSKNISNEAKNKVCFKFGISSSKTGTVLGTVVLEQYKVYFDRENKSIGFTLSSCDNAMITDINGYVNKTECEYTIKDSSHLQIISYVVLAIFLICMIPICAMLCMVLCKKEDYESGMSDTSTLITNTSLSQGNGTID